MRKLHPSASSGLAKMKKATTAIGLVGHAPIESHFDFVEKAKAKGPHPSKVVVRETPSFEPFCTKDDHFARTGSGQT